VPLAEKGVRGKGRQPLSPPSAGETRRALARRIRTALFTHRVAAHFEAMGVVNQPVEDAVSGRGIADLLVPSHDRQLGGEDGRASLIAVLADLPEVAPFLRHAPEPTRLCFPKMTQVACR
jgi:hypothetical protein